MSKKIAVIGIGDFGMQLVKCIYEAGHEVLAIDKDEDLIDEIKDNCTNAICLDATDENSMKSLGLEDFDYVILATADNFETLIITADILKRNNVKSIHARYQTELHIRILNMLGITNIFNPEERAAKNMAEMFDHSNIKDSNIISENFRIADLVVPDFFIGKNLCDVQLKEKYNLLLVTIKRNIVKKNKLTKTIVVEAIGIPSPYTEFQKNDVMIVFGSHVDVEKFLSII